MIKPLRSLRTHVAFACALAFLSFIASATRAQQPQPAPTPLPFGPQLVRQLETIQSRALESDYALRQVEHLTNNIGPRLTGSAQAQAAVEYVAAEMRRLGLEVHLEKLSVPHWVRGE